MKQVKTFIRSRFPFVGTIKSYLRFERRLNPDDVTFSDALRFFERRRESYETLVNIVAERVNPTGLMIDVGANIGFFSRLLMDRIAFRGKAHLFEPIPNLARLCAQTFSESTYDVEIHTFGLGDENSQAVIYMARDGNIGWNTIVTEKAESNMQPLTIQIKRFDELGIPVPDFVKIDVEGAEYKVLNGMLTSLRKADRLPLILCELGWGQSHPNFPKVVKTFDSLFELGYSITDLSGENIEIQTVTSTIDVLMNPPH